ncbi:RNA exonuclease 3 [Arthroderma uncinatum]|uniref:RNA exonuclease 3 n=1 Tax=Arthroderma uncinatum TaxID=74035 RepID=UPI00144A6920|nr:RNA exonuclease 3 [Arthroderma uncinatum]KAF3490749.1 RNA exonuclease 3 [Arthroderma uncinatum]
MFGSLGLFSAVPCPQNGRCNIINCIFAHKEVNSIAAVTPVADSNKATSSHLEITSGLAADEPHRKRRRLSDDGKSGSKVVSHSPHEGDTAAAQRGSTATQRLRNDVHNLSSLKKRVSPPPVARATERSNAAEGLKKNRDNSPKLNISQDASSLPTRHIKKETLNPRHLSKPPASHAIRMSILIKLHGAMVRLNEELKKSNDQSKKCLTLSADELVSMALDEEEKIAKESPAVYSNVIKLRIVKLTKMKPQEWQELVLAFIRPDSLPAEIKGPNIPPKPVLTGLSVEEERAVLSTLYASSDDLKRLEYVTSPPSEEDIASAKRGIEASQGWEKCDRCNGRFQVFPGRRADGALTSSGPCVYHYARPIRPPKNKTDHIVGQKEFYYPCCKETVGTSPGCTRVDSHVFKVTDMKRLAATMQFEKTPRQTAKQALPPVCFDCEMGYTTLGLEMIRLTAVSWPEGKLLIDVLVRPIGEILDLNTRYSGVQPEQFANATPYKGSHMSTSTYDQADCGNKLQMVESPAAARALLFQHLQPETSLLGHALENDLNVCRIIHPTIVDTVLLYPHPAGLPMRNGLRALTKRYLGRDIQAGGGTEGHDSIEDAKATGDLVRFKVGEKWKTLKRSGWELHDGKLIDPTKAEKADKESRVLEAAVGVKRKANDDNE